MRHTCGTHAAARVSRSPLSYSLRPSLCHHQLQRPRGVMDSSATQRPHRPSPLLSLFLSLCQVSVRSCASRDVALSLHLGLHRSIGDGRVER